MYFQGASWFRSRYKDLDLLAAIKITYFLVGADGGKETEK
jgi:hypothetical protein